MPMTIPAARQLLVLLTLTTAGLLANAKVAGLPPQLQSLETQIETAHEAGLSHFFEKLNEDCDSLDILNSDYQRVKTLPASPNLFRIESRVVASCQRQELWFCHSSFLADGTYRFTDCETDSPTFDQ